MGQTGHTIAEQIEEQAHQYIQLSQSEKSNRTEHCLVNK